MIVKIQIPLNGYDLHVKGGKFNELENVALVYNEDRSFETFTPFDDELASLMKGEVKKFFHISFIKSGKKNKGIIINREAEWQDW